MTGVEILAMEEVAVAFGWNTWGMLFGFIVAAGIFGLAGLLVEAAEGPGSGWVVFVSGTLIAGLIMGLAFSSTCGEPTAYETQYKVTVSDKVSMNEFLERYELIDQEGKVYVVRERDDYMEPETKEPAEKTGYWTGWEGAECSECGQFNVMVYSGKHLNYCPDCGTKMEPKGNVKR